jgi:PHD-finger
MSPISTRTRKSTRICKRRKLDDDDFVCLDENRREQEKRTHCNNFGRSYDGELSLKNSSECSSTNANKKLFANCTFARDTCIWALRNHGVLQDRKEETNKRINNYQNEIQPLKCRSCTVIGHSTKMLICDNCEGPFHLKCSGMFLRRALPEEWYCHPCSRIKQKGALRKVSLRSENLIKRSEELRRKKFSEYTSSVRIGQAFQAEVQEWFGPTHKYVFLS